MLCFGEETARSMYSFFCCCPFQFSPHNLKVACQKQNTRVKLNEARTKQKKKKKRVIEIGSRLCAGPQVQCRCKRGKKEVEVGGVWLTGYVFLESTFDQLGREVERKQAHRPLLLIKDGVCCVCVKGGASRIQNLRKGTK